MGKVEEYKEKFQEFEKKAEEEAKLFDIDELLKDADTVLEKYVEGIGVIRYKRLSFIEASELIKSYGEDREKFALATVARMLSKADPRVTVDKLGRLPTSVVVKIMNALAEEVKLDFLPKETP